MSMHEVWGILRGYQFDDEQRKKRKEARKSFPRTITKKIAGQNIEYLTHWGAAMLIAELHGMSDEEARENADSRRLKIIKTAIEEGLLKTVDKNMILSSNFCLWFEDEYGVKPNFNDNQDAERKTYVRLCSSPDFSTRQYESACRFIEVISVVMLGYNSPLPVSGRYAETLLGVLLDIYGSIDQIPKEPTLRKEIEQRITRLDKPASEREALQKKLPSRNTLRTLLQHINNM